MSEVVYEDKDTQRSSHYMDTPYVDISYEIVLVERRISLCEELKKVLFLIGYGTRKLWRYFINSQNSLAVFLARLCKLKTLQIEYMENCKLLDELNKRKEEEKKEEDI